MRFAIQNCPMNSPTNDEPGAARREAPGAWVSACSIEIGVHLVLFSVILLPFVFLVFPFLVFHVGASLININLSDDWHQWKGTAAVPLLSDAQEIDTAIALVLGSLAAAGFNFRHRLRQLNSEVSVTRRYKSLIGQRGLVLRTRMSAFWSQLAGQATPPPDVVWFPSSALLAQALIRSGQPIVAVSAGLWERAGSADPIADIIMLHELAHLAYGDPTRFNRLNSVLETANRTLVLLLRVMGSVVAFLMIQQLLKNCMAHLGTGPILRQELMIGAIGALAMSICPVTAAMVRRYVGLVTALIELRADVRSAQWSGGLKRFTEILANHPLVHQSTFADKARSMFSLRLTHLSESERIDLLGRPHQLLTPKVRYFLFSLILVLLLPLNGLTPLFEGGIFDLAAVATVAVALVAAVSTMVVVGAHGEGRMPFMRLARLSLCVVLFTAACQINLYTLTYSMSTLAVTLGLPASGLTDSFSVVMISALHDIRGQLLNIWSDGWLPVSVLIGTLAFAGLWIGARILMGQNHQVSLWSLTMVGAAAGIGVVVDGNDPWRISVIEHTLFGRLLSDWADVTRQLPLLRFTLGPCLALAGISVMVVLRLGMNIVGRGTQPGDIRPHF
jgi:hypothetical protein